MGSTTREAKYRRRAQGHLYGRGTARVCEPGLGHSTREQCHHQPVSPRCGRARLYPKQLGLCRPLPGVDRIGGHILSLVRYPIFRRLDLRQRPALRLRQHRSLPSYAQVNTGMSHEFDIPGWKPVTLRFDVVNVFDTSYVIKDGSGIGVFATRMGLAAATISGLSQKFGPGATSQSRLRPRICRPTVPFDAAGYLISRIRRIRSNGMDVDRTLYGRATSDTAQQVHHRHVRQRSVWEIRCSDDQFYDQAPTGARAAANRLQLAARTSGWRASKPTSLSALSHDNRLPVSGSGLQSRPSPASMRR